MIPRWIGQFYELTTAKKLEETPAWFSTRTRPRKPDSSSSLKEQMRPPEPETWSPHERPDQTQIIQAFAEALCSKPLLYPCISKRSCTERNETENERQTLEIIQGAASTSSQFADPDGLRLPGADGGWLLSAAGRCMA